MINIVGLPILLASYGAALFLIQMVMAILSDGASIPFSWYVSGSIILSLCGAVMGASLGHQQSLALKPRIPQSGKWIRATSISVAVAVPISWLIHRWVFQSSLLDHWDGLYPYFLSQYIPFGVLLGVSVGAAQALVLEPQIHKAERWMFALPILFTGCMVSANFGFLYRLFIRSVQGLIQSITNQSFEIRFPVLVVFLFFAILPAVIALAAFSLLSGIFLDWLFQSNGQQNEEQ